MGIEKDNEEFKGSTRTAQHMSDWKKNELVQKMMSTIKQMTVFNNEEKRPVSMQKFVHEKKCYLKIDFHKTLKWVKINYFYGKEAETPRDQFVVKFLLDEDQWNLDCKEHLENHGTQIDKDDVFTEFSMDEFEEPMEDGDRRYSFGVMMKTKSGKCLFYELEGAFSHIDGDERR